MFGEGGSHSLLNTELFSAPVRRQCLWTVAAKGPLNSHDRHMLPPATARRVIAKLWRLWLIDYLWQL